MEDKLEGAKEELIKGNQIIQKQQAENKSVKNKLKMKNTVCMQ